MSNITVCDICEEPMSSGTEEKRIWFKDKGRGEYLLARIVVDEYSDVCMACQKKIANKFIEED